jgi:hypothetical protein
MWKEENAKKGTEAIESKKLTYKHARSVSASPAARARRENAFAFEAGIAGFCSFVWILVNHRQPGQPSKPSNSTRSPRR